MKKLITKMVVIFMVMGCNVVMAKTLNVLILSGQNNHKWQKTTPVLKEMLESSGQFTVSVTNSPQTMTSESLQDFDLMLSNWNSYGKWAKVKTWPEETKKAFVDFIKSGKGLVVVHAGGTSFPKWKEYHKIVGATWGKGSGHGPVHDFDVKLTGEHIITKTMKPFRTNEELWHRMVVNGDINVLAIAYSNRSKQDEPVAFTTEYGKGRCFNLVLGAFDYTMKNSPEFKTFLLRGSEWAATGTIVD